MRSLLVILLLGACASTTRSAAPVVPPPVDDCELMPVVPASVGVAQPSGGLLFATIAGKLEAVDLASGTQRWAVDGEWRPLVADDRDVVVAGGTQVRVLEAATGKLRVTSAPLPGVPLDWRVTRACRTASQLRLQWDGMTPGQHLGCCNGGDPGHAVGGVVAIGLQDGALQQAAPLPPEPPLAEWPNALVFEVGHEKAWASSARTLSLSVDETLPGRLLLLRRDRATGSGQEPVVLKRPFAYQTEYRRRIADGAPELININVMHSTDGEWVVLQTLAPDRSQWTYRLVEVATGASEPFPLPPPRWQGLVWHGVLVGLDDPQTWCQAGVVRTLRGYDLHTHRELWQHPMPCVPPHELTAEERAAARRP